MRRRAALCLLFTAIALVSRADVAGRSAAMNRFPSLMLWAWERPEDFRTLAPDVGVAFLAQTLGLDGADVRIEPRRQPMRVATGTSLVAVTRIERRSSSSRSDLPSSMDTAALIAATLELPRVRGVQIDFDATSSERAFYRAVLSDLRHTIGPVVPVSITALASWCVGDRWIDTLPIDEAVPMLFRMGPFDERFRAIAAMPGAASPRCAHALGVSLDEPLEIVRAGRRLYVFNPSGWSAPTLARAREVAR